MMWQLALMAMMPAIMQAMQNKPQQPGAAGYNQIPNGDMYMNKIMDTGFNPNSAIYKMASDQAMAQVNHQLMKQGILNSSAGNQAISGTQSDLANKFLQEELNRQIQAFQMANGYNDSQNKVVDMRNQDAWARYMAERQGQQQQMQMFGQMAQAGMSAYGQYNQQQLQQQGLDQNQQYMDRMFPQQNTGGGYYSPPPSYSLGANYQGIK
jgi:hypothetical protein